MDILIENAQIITLDGPDPVLPEGFLGISEGKITYVGDKRPSGRFGRVIDGRGKLALPGLVNAHTHVSMSILRGFADDYALQPWLEEHIWPAEAKMDARCIKAGALLGMAEMIASGTVSISDMYAKIPAVAEAAFETGLYANISNGALRFDPSGYRFEDENSTREMAEMLESWHGRDGGRILLDAAIHAEYTSFDRLWRDSAEYAAQNGLRMQVHLSETAAEHQACLKRHGRTPARVLADAGVFDVPAVAAHCVYVTDEDIELLREKGVTAAHNPMSNLKLASGVAPVPALLSRGVNVALGTDSVASNNSHDLFEEIKLAAVLHKGVARDPSAVPALTALEMATVNGARAQGREGHLGRLRVGMDASLILLDLSAPGLTPVHSPISSAVYAARGGDVCLTMVRGRVLYENGVFYTLDLEALGRELESYVMPRVFGA